MAYGGVFSTAIFQSTLPVREATEVDHVPALMAAISIHASREGSDILMPVCSRHQ